MTEKELWKRRIELLERTIVSLNECREKCQAMIQIAQEMKGCKKCPLNNLEDL